MSSTTGYKSIFALDLPSEDEIQQDYFNWLNSDRKHREMHFQLNVWVAKMRAKFSYLRLEGISDLVSYLRSLKDDEIEIFTKLQDITDENVALQVWKNIIEPTLSKQQHILNNTSTSNTSNTSGDNTGVRTISSTELCAALDLIQGCCLLHYYSKKVIGMDCSAIPILIDYLGSPSANIQLSVLDCILGLLVDCDDTQRIFRDQKGIKKVVDLLKSKDTKKDIRNRCAQFLVFIMRYFTGLGIEENKRAVIQVLGDKMTSLLSESIKMSSSKDKNEKFESFIKQLDSTK